MLAIGIAQVWLKKDRMREGEDGQGRKRRNVDCIKITSSCRRKLEVLQIPFFFVLCYEEFILSFVILGVGSV